LCGHHPDMFCGLLPTQEHLRTLNQLSLGTVIARATVYRRAVLLDLHFVLALTFEVFTSLNTASKYRDYLQTLVILCPTEQLTGDTQFNDITKLIMYCSHCC
jgi:hypothetical protein